MYVETRSKHALAVDRALKARKRYGTFNDKYAAEPNRSDVEGYDTTQGEITIKPTPKQPRQKSKPTEPKQRPKEHTTEYIPKGRERAQLETRFSEQGFWEQHKDLLTTRNVVHSRQELEAWKANPKKGDIRGIDTQPEELISARISAVHSFVPGVRIIQKKTGRRDVRGQYRYLRNNQEDSGEIWVRPEIIGTHEGKTTLAHELGHAYDRIKWGIPRGGYGTGNISPYWHKEPKKENGMIPDIVAENAKKNKGQLIDFLYKENVKIPRENVRVSDRIYLEERGELFARWFGGIIVSPSRTRRKTRGFYNVFKKSNKELFKALKESDLAVTKKYIKTKKKKKGSKIEPLF